MTLSILHIDKEQHPNPKTAIGFLSDLYADGYASEHSGLPNTRHPGMPAWLGKPIRPEDYASATDPSSNQQLDERPFHEVASALSHSNGFQPAPGANIWDHIKFSDGWQPSTASFGSYLDDNLFPMPTTQFEPSSFQASSAWMPQFPAQDFALFDFQDQPAMFGVDGAQSANLGEAHMPASSRLVTAPADSTLTVPQTNVDPGHRCPLGCPKTFRRAVDYRRHMKKHETPKYRCIMMDCDKTFYRRDKLRDHMKQGHKLTL